MWQSERPTGGRWYAGSHNAASGRKVPAKDTMEQPIHGKAVWTCKTCGKQVTDPHKAINRYPLGMTCICLECEEERKEREREARRKKKSSKEEVIE